MVTDNSRLESLLKETNDLLRQLVAATSTPVGFSEIPEPGIIKRVQVEAANTPIKGPDVEVPAGFDIAIRQRHHTSQRTGYVAFSEGAAKDPASRSELRNGEGIFLRVTNLKQVWFSASAATTNFEILAQLNPLVGVKPGGSLRKES